MVGKIPSGEFFVTFLFILNIYFDFKKEQTKAIVGN